MLKLVDDRAEGGGHAGHHSVCCLPTVDGHKLFQLPEGFLLQLMLLLLRIALTLHDAVDEGEGCILEGRVKQFEPDMCAHIHKTYADTYTNTTTNKQPHRHTKPYIHTHQTCHPQRVEIVNLAGRLVQGAGDVGGLGWGWGRGGGNLLKENEG